MSKEKADKKPVEEMSVEECFAELETVVFALENEQILLEDSVKLFERGVALSKRCSDALTAVERKIQQVVEKSNGEITFDDFAGSELTED